MTEEASVAVKADEAKERLKDSTLKGISIAWFLGVVAHTMNLQSEAILIRNACKGDLSKAARMSSLAHAASGIIGLIVNQIGGKLSDSMGRKPFYIFGPLMQIITGLVCFAKPNNLMLLVIFKAAKMCATTFSGTVMGSAGMRDVFEGEEFGVKVSKAGSAVGLGIMAGPLLESIILKMRPDNEHMTYLGLAFVGALSGFLTLLIPETLNMERKAPFDLSAALKSANPFGFFRIYTHGTPAVRNLATIVTMQSLADGKNVSDLVQIWTREHLKLSMETIRNFVMGYGFASMVAGAKLGPYLLKRFSVYGYSSFTNATNLSAFVVRGSAENVWLFFAALPLMLPGVNAASTLALNPVLNKHMEACGFGIGESSAWVNNLRVLSSAAASLFYAYYYSWCRRRGIYAGTTFTVVGVCGAALPQLLLMRMDKTTLDAGLVKKM